MRKDDESFMIDRMNGDEKRTLQKKAAQNAGIGKTAILMQRPVEPEDLEKMAIPELAAELEKLEYCLLCMEDGERHGCADAAKDDMGKLREKMARRVLEKLDISGDGKATDLLNTAAYGEKLDSPEELVACWYLGDCFPEGIPDGMLERMEKELKRQRDALDETQEEALDSGDPEFWRFRYDQIDEQLEALVGLRWRWDRNELEDLFQESWEQ